MPDITPIGQRSHVRRRPVEDAIPCPGCGCVMSARSLTCDRCWRALPQEVKVLRMIARSHDADQYAVRTVLYHADRMMMRQEGGRS
jgi:hypothetical protein